LKGIEEACNEEKTEVECRIVDREVIVNEKRQRCETKIVPECKLVDREVCKAVPKTIVVKVPENKCEEVCLPRFVY
jgi:hypothetical protein